MTCSKFVVKAFFVGFAFCCVLRSSWAQQAPEFGENDESSDVGFGGVTPGPELQVLESVSPNVDGIMMSSSPETESEIIVSSPEGDEDALVTSMPDVEGIIGKGDKGLFVDECLSDTECGKDEYCFLNYADTRGCVTGACDIRPRVCLKRKEINVGCNLTLECEEGLYCENGIGVGKMVCKERIALGEACKRFSEDGCEVGLNCLGEGEKGICGVLKKAEAGESCLNVECKEGLFCDESGSGMGGFNKKCAKTHIEGEKCTPFSSGQCEDGFCMSDFKGSEQFGVCIKFPGVGGPCLFDTDCMSLEPDPIFGRSPPVVCNLSKNPLFGTCINETALIKEPGADCEANLDACDGRRGLACEEIDSKYVCVQRVDIGGRGSRACTPGSPHSFCDKSDSQGRSPTECRRALGLNSKTAYGTSQCLAKIEVVTKGEICNKEDFVVCEDGTSCEVGPGIGIRDPSPRDIVYPVRYCMKKIPAGGNCASKFEVTCKEGSTCVAGVCSATAALVKVPETMAGFFDDCSTMPCAPGLVCKSQEFRPVKQVCQAPAVMVGAGEACASNGTVSKMCKGQLTCKPNPESESHKCGPKSSVGEHCEDDGDCVGGLTCVTDRLGRHAPKCMNSKGISLGGSCKAAASGDGHDCGMVADERRGGSSVALKCLPKGDSFACQIERNLYETCSESSNNACIGGLSCDGDLSLCRASDFMQIRSRKV